MIRKNVLLALEAGKLATLLQSLAPVLDNRQKAKDLARIRSRLETLFAMAHGKDHLAMQGIQQMHALLLQLPRLVNIEALVRHATGEKVLRYMDRANLAAPMNAGGTPEINRRLVAYIDSLLAVPVSEAPKPSTNPVSSTFARLVRATDWSVALLKLEVDPTLGARLAQGLLDHFSSAAGREQAPLLLESLVTLEDDAAHAEGPRPATEPGATESEAGEARLAPLYVLTLQLSTDAVLARPEISKLLSETPAHVGEDTQDIPALTTLLAEACQPVPFNPGDDPETVAQRQLANLVTELKARKTALKRKESARKRKTLASQQDQAVDALKTIPPKLLELLKANPELVNRA